MMPRMTFGWWAVAASPLAHITGRAAIPAVALFLAGVAAAFGAAQPRGSPRTVPRRAMSLGLGVLAAGCLLLATVLPILFH
jgi:hypothetical protein